MLLIDVKQRLRKATMAKVFLSHSSDDKEFVRTLAASLQECGIDSWIDEAEIHFGDSLIQRISDSIERIDLVIAVISEGSVDSSWVRKELEWALTREIQSRRIVVIPILLDRVDIPFFLVDKLYADFTDARTYADTVKRLADSIKFHVTGDESRSHGPDDVPGIPFPKSYRPLKFSLITSGMIIALAVLVVSLLLAYEKTEHSTKYFQEIKFTGVVVACEFMAIALIETFRDLLIWSLISRNPNFARDISGFSITGLPIKRYRRFVARYWHLTLMKVAVLCEICVLLCIPPVAMGVLRIGYLFFVKD